MAADRATPLHPTEVEHNGHTIKLTHRPKINDWTYEVVITRKIRLSNSHPRYETALSHAKADIDAMT